MMRRVWLTDTTLRDGAQSPGIAISTGDRLRLLQALDETGVYQIDAGIPVMDAQEKDALSQMMALRKRIKVSTWNRMNPRDVASAMELNPDVIHISLPVSERLIHSVLRQDREFVVHTAKACAAAALERGFEVTVGFQDASRADTGFMILLANCLGRMGVSMVRLADTVGILTPSAVRRLVGTLRRNTDIPLGIHTHNDLGMAVPVALEAVKAGVSHVDVTCLGIGERAGNCDLFSFVNNGWPAFPTQPRPGALAPLRALAADILSARFGDEPWNCANS